MTLPRRGAASEPEVLDLGEYKLVRPPRLDTDEADENDDGVAVPAGPVVAVLLAAHEAVSAVSAWDRRNIPLVVVATLMSVTFLRFGAHLTRCRACLSVAMKSPRWWPSESPHPSLVVSSRSVSPAR